MRCVIPIHSNSSLLFPNLKFSIRPHNNGGSSLLAQCWKTTLLFENVLKNPAQLPPSSPSRHGGYESVAPPPPYPMCPSSSSSSQREIIGTFSPVRRAWQRPRGHPSRVWALGTPHPGLGPPLQNAHP